MVKDIQLKADLIALGKEIDRLVAIPKPPKRCKYCGIETTNGNRYGVNGRYCSLWCKEQDYQDKAKMYNTKCKVEGCNELYMGLGYCNKHYKRFKTHGDPLYVRPVVTKESKPKKVCSIDGCNEKHKGLGYCKKHYGKFKYHGDANWTKPNKSGKICSVEGCGRPHRGRGLCNSHYASAFKKNAFKRNT